MGAATPSGGPGPRQQNSLNSSRSQQLSKAQVSLALPAESNQSLFYLTHR